MRKEIIYPGNNKQPCVANYEITYKSHNYINHAQVIIYELYEKNPGGTCVSYSEIFEHLVNKILKSELSGVRLDFVEFYYIWMSNGDEVVSQINYTIDTVSFIESGGKHKSIYSSIYRNITSRLISMFGVKVFPDKVEYSSRDVVAGKGEVRVIEEPLKCVTQEKI